MATYSNHPQQSAISDTDPQSFASTAFQGASKDPDLSTLWWNTNLPPSQHTTTCPFYLQYALTHDKERANLSLLDRDYHRLTWPEALEIVATNRLDLFTRLPSEVRKYRRYCEETARDWGSVTDFIVSQRLGWRKGEMVLEGGLEREENFKILPNDWPYGFAPSISHLVVWLKFSLPSDEVRQELLPEFRSVIEAFVRQRFGKICGEQKVCWFRNWGALKSVGAVEHFHVLLHDAPEGFVREITGE